MTRPDLDALQALLDKNPHDGTDAAQALLALPALIARVRELEQERDEARAERDALRECVKAADAMRLHVRPCRCETCGRPECDAPREYDRARAAWKDEV